MTPHYSRALDDKYEIIKQIKQGGFGIVYYGLDKKLNKPVAIKEIAPNLLDEPKYLDMFQEEALNIAKLSHNNIVHIYELKKTSNGHLFIIMEYIDGVDLEKIIRGARKNGEKLPGYLAVQILAEICTALDYAHQRRDAFTNKPLNLVHQDISPSNIMISRRGDVKLIDFGIATVRKHRKERKDNKLRGKIPYMAPEQLIMGSHPDHRSDIFSLGLVLFEAITGQRLFNTQEEVMAVGKNPKWFKKSLKGRKIPLALGKIMLKALETDLSKRYQTANHMYIDLLQYLISSNETGDLKEELADFLNKKFHDGVSPQTPSKIIPMLETNSKPNYQTSVSDQISPIRFADPKEEDTKTSPHWETEASKGKPVSKEVSARTFLPPVTPQVDNFPAAARFSSGFKTMEIDADDGGEELKTVIDVVRMQAKSHGKHFIQLSILLLIGFFLYTTFDAVNGWTLYGREIYNFVFPPAIEIETVPRNAKVLLDGKETVGNTPLAIQKISPGVHKLELALAGYKPIEKAIFVRGDDIKIKGGNPSEGERKYLFRFSKEIEINSIPPNADVYINSVKFPKKTPCQLSWEVGSPFMLELRKEGFETLSDYTLHTAEGYDEVEDRRLWDMRVISDQYSIKGIFRKNIDVASVPTGVRIVDVKTEQILGVTGGGSRLTLPVGEHELIFQKNGFISQPREIIVNEAENESILVVMSRKVRITAVDVTEEGQPPLEVNLISLRQGDREALRSRRTTPAELNLPAYKYKAIFSKPGYQRLEVEIEPDARSVIAEMRALKSIIEFNIEDALTEKPITEAEITINSQGNDVDPFMVVTGGDGLATGQFLSGSYSVLVRKDGYVEASRSVTALPGETYSLVFQLYPSN